MSQPVIPQLTFTCDPELNTTCSKSNCFMNGGPCEHTHNVAFAKQPIEKVFLRIPMSDEEAAELATEELPNE